MGEEIKISKLTVQEVEAIQAAAREKTENKEEQDSGIEMIQKIIQTSVEEARDLSTEDFRSLPIDELAKLSNAIMEYSGLGEKGK